MINFKKKRERLFLDEAIALYKGFPMGEIIEGETPDFKIIQDNLVTGIEMVEFIRGQNKGGSTNRRNEILWQEIAKFARSEYECKHSEPLMVRYLWDKRYLLRKKEVENLAHESFILIEANIPQLLFEQIRIGNELIENTQLEDICNSIYITRARNSDQVLWSFVSVDFTDLQSEEIQNIIDRKTENIGDYITQCKSVILLIIAEGFLMSSTISLTKMTEEFIYSSPFDQVLLYDRTAKRVISLKNRKN
jgi:hypothetical protein